MQLKNIAAFIFGTLTIGCAAAPAGGSPTLSKRMNAKQVMDTTDIEEKMQEAIFNTWKRQPGRRFQTTEYAGAMYQKDGELSFKQFSGDERSYENFPTSVKENTPTGAKLVAVFQTHAGTIGTAPAPSGARDSEEDGDVQAAQSADFKKVPYFVVSSQNRLTANRGRFTGEGEKFTVVKDVDYTIAKYRIWVVKNTASTPYI